MSAAQTFRGTGVPAFILHETAPTKAWAPLQAAGTLWVVEAQASAVVAYLAARRTKDVLHVHQFDVTQAHQGCGIGRRLLAHVIAWAGEEGLSSLTLTTFRTIPWNGPFYRSCGFAEWTVDLSAYIEAELAKEAANGLKDRCAMRLLL